MIFYRYNDTSSRILIKNANAYEPFDRMGSKIPLNTKLVELNEIQCVILTDIALCGWEVEYSDYCGSYIHIELTTECKRLNLKIYADTIDCIMIDSAGIYKSKIRMINYNGISRYFGGLT